MAERSKAECAQSIEQRLEAVLASLSDAGAPAHRPSKPIALTLRLDSARYTPRRSFQAIIVEALDAYLDE